MEILKILKKEDLEKIVGDIELSIDQEEEFSNGKGEETDE